jgi:hypothetical protein
LSACDSALNVHDELYVIDEINNNITFDSCDNTLVEMCVEFSSSNNHVPIDLSFVTDLKLNNLIDDKGFHDNHVLKNTMDNCHKNVISNKSDVCLLRPFDSFNCDYDIVNTSQPRVYFNDTNLFYSGHSTMPDTQMVNRLNCAVDTGFIPQGDTCIYSMTLDSKFCTVCESHVCVLSY